MPKAFMKIKHKYIFQIGFNRCATQAITNAFQILGLKTIHHNFRPSHVCPREYLAVLMYNNLKPTHTGTILQYELKDYQCFLDMEYTYENKSLNFYSFFKEMEQQNNGSSFIMNTRSCESWLLSRIKLGKVEEVSVYFKDITEDKLKEWIEHYFDHSIKVREYFVKNKEVAKRSKFYILPLDYKTVTELINEMGLYDDTAEIVEKVDFAKKVTLKEEDKKLPAKIIELINEKIKIHGDPSTIEWWKN
jgi:hypothetical protein